MLVLLAIAIAMIGVDRVVANHQLQVLRASVSKVVLASLKQEANENLDQSLRAHWISTNEGGNVEGRISAIDPAGDDALPIERLSVSLMKQGEKVRKATTDDDGRFVLKDVPKGVYTLLASGRNGFLAYGVQVLPRLEDLDLDELDLDVRQLKPSARRAFYVSHFNLPKNAVVREELQIDAAAVPPQFKTLKRISRNYLSASSALSIAADTTDLKGIDKASVVHGGFQVSLEPDGAFVGRIQPIATDDGRLGEVKEMNLFLVKDDKEIDRVPAEKNGEFRIEDVEPGVYALIAAGKDGFAAMSLELVETAAEEDGVDGNAAVGGIKAMFASMGPKPKPAVQRDLGKGFACVYTNDPRSIAAIVDEIEQIEPEEEDDDEGLVWFDGANGLPAGNAGFPASGVSAPYGGTFGSPVSGGFTSPGVAPSSPAAGFRGGFRPGSPAIGRFLPFAGIITGVVGISTSDGGPTIIDDGVVTDPPDNSPNQTGGTPATPQAPATPTDTRTPPSTVTPDLPAASDPPVTPDPSMLPDEIDTAAA